MKSHTEYLVFETKKRREMVHITEQVERAVRKSGVKDGLCFVSPMHITAAIYVNDLGPDPSRPGGPPAKRQPSPEGLGRNPHHDPERHRRGTHPLLNQNSLLSWDSAITHTPQFFPSSFPARFAQGVGWLDAG